MSETGQPSEHRVIDIRSDSNRVSQPGQSSIGISLETNDRNGETLSYQEESIALFRHASAVPIPNSPRLESMHPEVELTTQPARTSSMGNPSSGTGNAEGRQPAATAASTPASTLRE